MPEYPWLFQDSIDYSVLARKMQVMQMLGVPYTQKEVDEGVENARSQAKMMIEDLKSQVDSRDYPKYQKFEDKKVIALTAYLRRLGTDLTRPPETKAAETATSQGAKP